VIIVPPPPNTFNLIFEKNNVLIIGGDHEGLLIHDVNADAPTYWQQDCPAGYDSRLNLLGVSTVAGNQTVEKVTLNALGVLTAAGLHDVRKTPCSRICPVTFALRTLAGLHGP